MAAAPVLASFRNAFFLLADVTHLFLQFDSAARMGRARGVISPSILLMRGGTRYSTCPEGQQSRGIFLLCEEFEGAYRHGVDRKTVVVVSADARDAVMPEQITKRGRGVPDGSCLFPEGA